MQTSVQHTLSAAVLILRHWLSVTIGCDWNTTVVKKASFKIMLEHKLER